MCRLSRQLEQTNQSLTNQCLSKKFNCIHTEKNKVPPGLKLQTLWPTGNGLTSKPSGKEFTSCYDTILKQVEDLQEKLFPKKKVSQDKTLALASVKHPISVERVSSKSKR